MPYSCSHGKVGTSQKPSKNHIIRYTYAYFWLHMPPSPYLVTTIVIFLPVQVEKKTKISTASWFWMQQLSFFTNYASAKINILRTLVLKMHVFINNETTPYNPMAACALWSYFDVLFCILNVFVMAAPTLVPPQQRAPCHKASCSGATKVDATNQGTVDLHFWDAFIKNNPCLNCGHRRPPALWFHFGFLFRIIVLDPKCYCNGGADLGAAAARASGHQTMERIQLSWIHRIPGSPGWAPGPLIVHQTERFLKAFLKNCFIVSPARWHCCLSGSKHQCHIPAATTRFAQAKNFQKTTSCAIHMHTFDCICHHHHIW